MEQRGLAVLGPEAPQGNLGLGKSCPENVMRQCSSEQTQEASIMDWEGGVGKGWNVSGTSGFKQDQPRPKA